MKIKQTTPIDPSEIIRKVDLFLLIAQDTNLKKVSSIAGGEYAGACTFCGGKDRLRVQLKAPPGKKPQGARWFCRQCSPRWGNAISYVMKRNNLDFMTALKFLAGEGELNIQKLERPIREELKPQTDIIRATWVEAAYDFIEQCQDALWSDQGEAARTYLNNDRGLSDETLRHWLIGYNPNIGYGVPEEWGLPTVDNVWLPKGIVIPCHDAAGLHYLKIRQRVGEPKYFIVRGGQMWAYGLQTCQDASTAFHFESEFDTLLAWQSGLGVGFTSLPAGQELIRNEYDPFFTAIEDVIIALDNDDPGRMAAEKYRHIPHFWIAEPLPGGCKDLTEYWQLVNSHEKVLDWLLGQLEFIK